MELEGQLNEKVGEEYFNVYDELETFWSFNPPQTINDIRSYHFLKPISETPMAISIISPFLPNNVCTSSIVRVIGKKLHQNKTKKAAKRTRNGQKYHQRPHHQRILLKLC